MDTEEASERTTSKRAGDSSLVPGGGIQRSVHGKSTSARQWLKPGRAPRTRNPPLHPRDPPLLCGSLLAAVRLKHPIAPVLWSLKARHTVR
ncbi:hypothetical protein JOQ06_021756 [Pogonophryne albipinna]|uniref:Uncharacterized protein n=1 Tax=Pogonophryne albipinna TaxID=1090488 RepID=A0AAD6A903_9TELE|nr:hypothetical protein JOQ06_021756 [Pogonophryne albipinna]